MTVNEISEELRAELVALVEAADLESPEQVCDWVLDAAERGGRDAAIAELERANPPCRALDRIEAATAETQQEADILAARANDEISDSDIREAGFGHLID
jgi:hypothetical protein